MKIIVKNQLWEEVRKKYKLSDAHIQMAKALGMNPKKIGKIANHKQQAWKELLADFIEACYYDKFKRNQPEVLETNSKILNK